MIISLIIFFFIIICIELYFYVGIKKVLSRKSRLIYIFTILSIYIFFIIYSFTFEISSSTRIFSYYLMKGMEGKADLNSDKKITNGELIAYLKQNVTEEAFVNNRQQEPMLSGNPDKVLISYR